MFEESTRLQDIRLERLKEMQNRHQFELDDFDSSSRRHIDNLRAGRSASSFSGSTSPRFSRAFNQGSPRLSNRSLGTPATRYPQSNRNSFISMSNLQSATNNSTRESSSSQFSNGPLQPAHSASNVTRTRSNESRNGNARLSYHEGSRK